MAYLNPAAGQAREATIATELGNILAAAPAAAVPDITATTNITSVPGEFADLPAVQSYLSGANVIPNIEARLDAIESRINTILARLRTLGLLAE
jgi:hypothetical protein